MALNPPLTLQGQPFRLENEFVLAQRSRVLLSVQSPAFAKLKAPGTLFLTTARLVFVNANFAHDAFKSFDMPLAHLFNVAFRRPLFGPKLLEFDCRPLLGRLPGDVRVRIRFLQGGADRFQHMFEQVRAQLRAAAQSVAPPFAQPAAAPPPNGVFEAVAQSLSQLADSVRVSLREIRGVGQAQLQHTAAQLGQQLRETNAYLRQQLLRAGAQVREQFGTDAFARKTPVDHADPTLVVSQQPPVFHADEHFLGHNIYRRSDGAPAAGSYPALDAAPAPPNDYRLPGQRSFYPVLEASAPLPQGQSLLSRGSTPDAAVYYGFLDQIPLHS